MRLKGRPTARRWMDLHARHFSELLWTTLVLLDPVSSNQSAAHARQGHLDPHPARDCPGPVCTLPHIVWSGLLHASKYEYYLLYMGITYYILLVPALVRGPDFVVRRDRTAPSPLTDDMRGMRKCIVYDCGLVRPARSPYMITNCVFIYATSLERV